MKGKNLERAVILGLILSAGVYGTAWAAINTEFPNENSVIIKANSTVSPDTIIKDGNGHEKLLNQFKYVTVYFSPQGNEDRALGVYSVQYQLTNTNVTVHVGDEEHAGVFVNADGLYLSNHYPNFYVRSYDAHIYGASSDALNLSHDITTNAYVYIGNTDEKMGVDGNGNLKAVIYDGNGIRANASTRGDVVNSITVGGETDITINGSTITRKEERTLTETRHVDIIGFGATVTAEVKANVSTSYNPTAVYAGNDMYNFTYNLNNLLEKDFGSETLGRGIVNLNNDTVIKLKGIGNYGIYSGKNGEINVNNVNIISTGENSVGIAAQNSNLIYGNPVNVTIADIHATAVADNFWNQLLVNFGLGLMVDSMKGESIIVDNADTSANKYGSTVILNGDKNVITMAKGGKALYANGKNLTDDDGEVIIKSGDNGIGNLDVKGDIVATNSGKIDLTVNKAADITGDIEATNSGVINFTLGDNADMIVSEKDNTLINAGGASTLSLAKNGSESKIGNVQAANGGTINLTLGDGAYFAGRVDDYKDADGANGNWNNEEHQTLFDSEFAAGVTKSGTVNMTLNGGVWNLTEQSWVSKVDGNSGFIYLDGDGTGGYAVHIGKLEGDHTFVLNLNPKEHEFSDMLYIYDGSTAGVQNLRINNEAEVLNALKNDGDRIRFATVGKTAGAGAGFGDDYVVRGRGVINSGFSIDYVDYDTDTDQGNYNGDGFSAAKPGDDYVDSIYGSGNNNSETGSQASTLENNAGTGNKPVAELDSKNLYLVRDSSKDAGKSDSGATIINMSRANYKNAIYMDRLNKRMGEMRYVNAEEEQGLWVRLRHDRIGQSGDFRSMNTMYEVGYDVKQPTDNGEHRIGMAIDYMRGSTTYDDIMGKGETKRYGLWLYDTWLGEKGHYTDYIVKWGHLSNDFDIRDKDSLENITGDYSNNVFSVSAEYGKKNDMGNNWYFEPQAQIQLARVTGADYVTTQGSKVNVDGINSLIGRAGFRIGRDMDENSTVYLKADLLHEFMGDQTVTAADATGTLREEFENKGTWYDIGFGFAAKMSKNSYAFMDFEKSFGNDNDETYQINAGMQWTF